MHPVTEIVYDLASKLRTRCKNGQLERNELASYDETHHCLSYVALQGRRSRVSVVEGHILPNLGLQVVRFEYQKPHFPSKAFDYYLDVVRAAKQGERWVVRDLYLDVLVFDGVRAEILDTDEYLAALHEGHLDAEEAAYALLKLHALIDGLGACGYDLERYLAAQGVTLTWRR